ncbi:Glutathione S-transferase 3 [Leucoagaricus sp. SymC.cos]|nr:Glutathione S-transferase 3 [Leucoagaricus sp. SymC.cos]
MVLKLYAFNLSPPSQMVATVLHEKQVPFEFINIDLAKGEQKSPDYLAMQPFGQIPVIDDDGLVVYESRAICRYLEVKYRNQGTQLIPTEIDKLARFEQAAFTEISNFDAHGTPIFFETIVKKFYGGEPDQKRVDELTKALSAKLDIYDKILSKQKYLAGDDLTLADLAHLPIGTLLPNAGIDITQGRPNVARWFDELSSRESWIKVKEGSKSTA